jgi:hypothetical protein
MRCISGQSQGSRSMRKRWLRAFALLSVACVNTAWLPASSASPMPVDSIAPKDKEMPGTGRLGGTHRSEAPLVRFGKVVVGDGIPAEVVRRILRQNYGRFRLCYEAGLKRNAELRGSVALRFVIEVNGSLSNVSAEGSTVPDREVVGCVVKAVRGLSFPKPEGAKVSVFSELQLFPPS